MRALWKDKLIAESDDTVVVDGDHYFPASCLDPALTLPSNSRSNSWKGEARYLTLFLDGDANPDAVWYYPEPSEAAAELKGRVAFWKGVQVRE